MSDTPSNQRQEIAHPSARTRGLFERVASIGAGSRTGEFAVSMVLALGLHFGLGGSAATRLFDLNLFANSIRTEVAEQLRATIELDPVMVPEPEPEEPEPEPEPEPEELEPVDETPPETSEQTPAPGPPPAAAEAGKILTSEPDPDEPLDLTDTGFISGNADRFAGGISAADGTSDKAVRNRKAQGSGAKGGRGSKKGAKVVPRAPLINKSRPAGLPRRASWNCGFPAEATAEQINDARVRIVVVVGKDGKPTSANVISDPGFGFAQRAKRCAMRYRYSPGLDKKGNPTVTTTKPFLVHFSR